MTFARMSPARRSRWTRGRFANVDAIPFTLPIETANSPTMYAAFWIDPVAARRLLPGQELHPLAIRGRGILFLSVVSYSATTIGTYIEFAVGVMVTRGRRPVPWPLGLSMRSRFGTGACLYDLPVSTEISVKGGLGIWGMPKRRASLDFVIGDKTVSSQYDLDGRCVLRLDVPRPRTTRVPMRTDAVSYGGFRGMLFKSRVHLTGRTGITLGGAGARLLVGDHPRAAPLAHLDIDPVAIATGFTPAMSGVLDDHVESWYLTSSQRLAAPAVGLTDVVRLGRDETWPPAPGRGHTDVLLSTLAPADRVRWRAAARELDGASEGQGAR